MPSAKVGAALWAVAALCVVPIFESLPALGPVVRDFEADTIRIGKEGGVVINGVFRVEPRWRTNHLQFGKAAGDGVNCSRVLDAEAKVVQAGGQRVVGTR